MIDTMLAESDTTHRADANDVLTIVVVAAYPSLRAGIAALLAGQPDLDAVELSPTAFLTDDAPTGDAILVIDVSGLDRAMLAALARLATVDDLPVIWIGDGQEREQGHESTPGGHLAPAMDRETLVAAVRAVAAGLRVMDPRLPADAAPASAAGDGDPLSPREREVLALVAAGHPNKAIARALGISEHTVKFHVSALLGKLGATSRTEAVTLATRRGLLSL